MPRNSWPLWLVALCAIVMAPNGPDVVRLSRLRADLQYLCSEKLQGRASLSPGADLAAGYIAAEFKKTGLSSTAANGDFLQKFTLIAPISVPPLPKPASLVAVREGTRIEFHPG